MIFMKTTKRTIFPTTLLLLCLLLMYNTGCRKCENQDYSVPGLGYAGQDLTGLDIVTLQNMMTAGSLSSQQLIQFYLDRIAEIDDSGPTLNSVLEINPEALAIAADLDAERKTTGARGPMHGIPVLLKANIDTGDQMTTTAGSLALAGFKSDDDAFMVARLREAGAIILGKTNLSEWANFRSTNSSSGWSSQGRQTKNPYALDRNPCGSSSGSAVAVSASLTAVAIGTETDGSIMCPSAISGVVGIKPTLGLVSRDGIIPIAHSQDTAGPMGRSVRDAATLLTAMVAIDKDDPAAVDVSRLIPDYLKGLNNTNMQGVRIGVLRDYHGAGANKDVEAAFTQAIETLKSMGVEVIDNLDMGDLEGMDTAEFEVLLYEFKADLAAYLEGHGAPNGMHSLEDLIAFNSEHADEIMPYFGQELFVIAAAKGPLTDQAYLDALQTSKSLSQNAINRAMSENQLDAIIAPTNGPAWPTDLINGDHFSIASSSLAAVSGYPSITVPMGDAEGLPVGLSFFGKAFSEAELIRIAYAFEQKTQARECPGFLPSLKFE